GAVLNVELELYRSAVGQDANDAPEIFVAQNNRGYDFGQVVGTIVKRANVPVRHVSIIGAQQCAVRDQEFINLLIDLPWRQSSGRIFLLGGVALRTKCARVGVLWIKPLSDHFVFQTARRQFKSYGNRISFAHQNDFSLHLILEGSEVSS